MILWKIYPVLPMIIRITRSVIVAGKWKIKLRISKNSNLQLKIGIFTTFSCIFHLLDYFPVNRIALE